MSAESTTASDHDDDAPSPYDDCGATQPDPTSVLHPGRPHYCVKQIGHEEGGDKKHLCERICGEEWITEGGA